MMKGQKFLKVTGILMIIFAVFNILFGVLIGGVGTLFAMLGGGGMLGFAFVCAIIAALVGGILQLIAGISGVRHCDRPENAHKCIVWGALIIGLSVISQILYVIGGEDFNVLSFVLGLIVPGLYIYGAILNRKEATNV